MDHDTQREKLTLNLGSNLWRSLMITFLNAILSFRPEGLNRIALAVVCNDGLHPAFLPQQPNGC